MSMLLELNNVTAIHATTASNFQCIWEDYCFFRTREAAGTKKGLHRHPKG